MKELSLHILDIMQNSIVAGADRISLTLVEDSHADLLSFRIEDNGKGMPKEMVQSVMNPFVTGRTTRRVGLGIPLLKAAAELTGGGISLSSREGEGTVIEARFGLSHIDRQPLGDMAGTMLGILTSYEDIVFIYTHRVDEQEYTLNTQEMRDILGDVSFSQPEVMLWLSEYLNENETALYQK
ncbi:MAG: ATP-binding protein [Clostridia bacterium]|nr:ATP-binding protein [Clostridia bacterium]